LKFSDGTLQFLASDIYLRASEKTAGESLTGLNYCLPIGQFVNLTMSV